MSKPFFAALQDLDAVENGAALDVSHLENVAVVVGGTFVGTWALQVSPDGTLWVEHATITGKTAAFAGEVGYRCMQVRTVCSAHTSGTIEGFVSGDDEDRPG